MVQWADYITLLTLQFSVFSAYPILYNPVAVSVVDMSSNYFKFRIISATPSLNSKFA